MHGISEYIDFLLAQPFKLTPHSGITESVDLVGWIVPDDQRLSDLVVQFGQISPLVGDFYLHYNNFCF